MTKRISEWQVLWLEASLLYTTVLAGCMVMMEFIFRVESSPLLPKRDNFEILTISRCIL